MGDIAAPRETGDAESGPTPHQDAAVLNFEAAQDAPKLDNDVATPNAGTISTPSTIKDGTVGPNTDNEQHIASTHSRDSVPMSNDEERSEPKKNPDGRDGSAGFEQDEGEETNQADEADKDDASQPATHNP